jgi:hypothetical protein
MSDGERLERGVTDDAEDSVTTSDDDEDYDR